MAGKNLFCKFDCSQAYHCLQMADQQSIELLAFNFASRTFAYRRLAQGLSRSLSAFSSFIREYLDPVIKADQCAQYIDDIGIAANTPEQLRKTYEQFPVSAESWPQTQYDQMPFWRTRSWFPWTNHNNQWSSTTKTKDCQIPRKSQIPTIQKSTSTLHWIPQLLPKLNT